MKPIVLAWILWTAAWSGVGYQHWYEIAAYSTQQECIDAAMRLGPGVATVCVEDN